MPNRARIKLIAAMGINHVIGLNNRLPWHLPAEWEYFHEVTQGRVFIMGRKSYFNEDALLSTKHNYVISRQTDLAVAKQTTAVHSLEQALAATSAEEDVFILGGASIFESAMQYADRLYLTIVHDVFTGDAFFPPIKWSEWEIVNSRRHLRDAKHSHTFSMNVYDRIKPSVYKEV